MLIYVEFITSFELGMNTIFTACHLSFKYQKLLRLYFSLNFAYYCHNPFLQNIILGFHIYQWTLLPSVPKYFFGHIPLSSDGNTNVGLTFRQQGCKASPQYSGGFGLFYIWVYSKQCIWSILISTLEKSAHFWTQLSRYMKLEGTNSAPSATILLVHPLHSWC